jgi:hypothetical protein
MTVRAHQTKQVQCWCAHNRLLSFSPHLLSQSFLPLRRIQLANQLLTQPGRYPSRLNKPQSRKLINPPRWRLVSTLQLCISGYGEPSISLQALSLLQPIFRDPSKPSSNCIPKPILFQMSSVSSTQVASNLPSSLTRNPVCPDPQPTDYTAGAAANKCGSKMTAISQMQIHEGAMRRR